MKILLEVLLNTLLAALSIFIPKNRNLVLVGTLYGTGFSGNPRALYLSLVERAGGEPGKALWITASKEVEVKLAELELPFVRLYSPRGFWSILRARVLVTGYNIRDVSYFQFLPGRFIKLQTWHGLPLKGPIPNLRDRFPRPLGYWLILRERYSNTICCTTSPETKAIELGMSDFYPRLEVTGYPRNDIFYRPELIVFDVRQELGLDEDAGIILFSPTFRDSSSEQLPFSDAFSQKLSQHLETTNQIFLITEHHLAQLQGLQQEHPRIRSLKSGLWDIQELLVQADLLITDYSSIALDYILTGRPVLFYPHDFEKYEAARGFSIDYFKDLPGPFVRSEAELLRLIQCVEDWSTESDYRRGYEQLVDRFHTYQDGNSAHRVCQLLETLT